MFVLLGLPLLVIAYFVGRRMRAKGQRFTIRLLASTAGASVGLVEVVNGLLRGNSIPLAIGSGVFLFIAASVGMGLLLCLLNLVRGEDDEHYYPW